MPKIKELMGTERLDGKPTFPQDVNTFLWLTLADEYRDCIGADIATVRQLIGARGLGDLVRFAETDLIPHGDLDETTENVLRTVTARLKQTYSLPS